MGASQQVRFQTEITRTISESWRDMYWKAKNAISVYYGGINSEFSEVGTGDVTESRSDGANTLTGEDNINVIAQLIDFVEMTEQAGVLDVIQKPCVRTY